MDFELIKKGHGQNLLFNNFLFRKIKLMKCDVLCLRRTGLYRQIVNK